MSIDLAAAWVIGLLMGVGFTVAAWLEAERRALELEARRSANERALRRHADRSWYIAGPERLMDAPRPLHQRRQREEREENGR